MRTMSEPATVKHEKREQRATGKYMYAIIHSDKSCNFGAVGIGNQGHPVHTIDYKDLACVVSDSPVTTYPITRENMMAHQKVLERVMKEYTVLPVRFGTIADCEGMATDVEQKIKERLLKPRYDEFNSLLSYMHSKVELGLKVLWANMDAVYAEIANEDRTIRQLRAALLSQDPAKTHYERIKVGELVKAALEQKKESERNTILSRLKPLAVDVRINKLFGDRMILNAAFLVDSANQDHFDGAVNRLEESNQAKVMLKYVGPVPPYNFVTIEVTWD